MKLKTLFTWFIGILIALSFPIGFGYVGYKVTENYCPCCFGCSFCIYGGAIRSNSKESGK